MTDPADDGLRMPLPLASMKIKKPKKKKKWFIRIQNYDFFIVYFNYLRIAKSLIKKCIKISFIH